MNIEQSPQLAAFIQAVSQSDTLWGLQSTAQDAQGEEEGWVICDSAEFEQTDTMPLWSSEEAAQAHCVDAWSGYRPAAISLDDFFEYWAADLAEDGVLLGLDWPAGDEGELTELEPVTLVKLLVGDQSQ